MTTPTRSSPSSGSDALSLTKAARQAGDASADSRAMNTSMPIADRYEIGHEIDSADAMTPGHTLVAPPSLPTTPASSQIAVTQRSVPGFKDDHTIHLPSPQSRLGKPVWSLMDRFPKASARVVAGWGDFLEFAPPALSALAFGVSSYSLAENWKKLSWQARTLNTSATAASGIAAGTGLAAAVIRHAATLKAIGPAFPAGTLEASPAMARAAMLGKVAGVSMALAGTIWTGMKVYNDFRDPSKNGVQRGISVGSAAMMTGATVAAFIPGGQVWSFGLMLASGATSLVGSWLDRFLFNHQKKTKRQLVFGALATATEGASFAAEHAKGRVKHAAWPLDKLDKVLVKESNG